MGCGGSVPVSRLTQNRTDLQYFEKHPKLRDKRESLSIEEARKRRAECAKERARRASVMGQLQAEKLSHRKRSNASMFNVSASDVSEESRIPPFEPKQGRSLSTSSDETANTESFGNPATRNGTNSFTRQDLSPFQSNNVRRTQIEITISPGSRPGSSKPGGLEADLPGMVISNEMKTKPDQLNESEFEEANRRRAAKVIVDRAISSALAKMNTR